MPVVFDGKGCLLQVLLGMNCSTVQTPILQQMYLPERTALYPQWETGCLQNRVSFSLHLTPFSSGLIAHTGTCVCVEG
ncbi:hypothetical protein NDU88_011384 [Pleurodeles waltl]|uniref:Uncharacterized protein n=1 Tax=Pleurodeles waltl TaxID=8319 RepID=A0AAV7Q4V1_PLEWA|nr:hypothetical protein NDU88_011384 [Pleurodeles waltl]